MKPTPEPTAVPARADIPVELTWDLTPLYATPESWEVDFARLDALGMRVLPVPRGPEWPDLAVMARYCELHAPKLFVSVSVLHNPTGYSLSPGSAHQVLQLAQQHNFHVV